MSEESSANDPRSGVQRLTETVEKLDGRVMSSAALQLTTFRRS
jgi:hypothetical protein